jgi:membrane protein YqaA with SNARE-associated domain
MLTGFDPGFGLWGLGLYSLLAATLLPGGSELALYAFLQYAPNQACPALLVATLGNTLGGLISWACGRFLPRWQRVERLPQVDRLRRWGSAALLISWMPLIGDALCIAAGWLRLHWLPCALFMAIGKGARYWLVVQAAAN